MTLSRTNGTGVLGGSLSCTIPAGSSSCTVTGVTYSVAEPSVVVTATRTGDGDVLGASASAPFAVGGSAVVSRKVHGGAGTFDLPLGIVADQSDDRAARGAGAHDRVHVRQAR